MSDPCTLAIDAGTGSCRAALIDVGGRVLGVGQREWSHLPAPGVPGSQVFDVEGGWRLIAACVREALEQAGVPPDAVAAVSATSMREGMVLYDASGRELWACPNVDSRAGDQAAALVDSGAAERIYALAGDWVAITAPARFLWLAAREPDTLAATAHVGMLSDWIVRRLSGEFATDPSAGSSSGMFDLARRTWAEEVIEICGLRPEIFPPVHDPGTVVGAVTRAAAEHTGLRPGTPVVMGGADTQLGLVGIGVVEPGRTTVVGGTFWQHTAVRAEPTIDPRARLRTLCHAVGGRWMVEGIGFWCGQVMRWFRDAFCEPERIEAKRSGADPYLLMERLAESVPPGANGVSGLFSNVMEARRWVHCAPALMGFDVTDPRRAGRGECIRAIEEGAAYVARGNLEVVQELTGERPSEVVFTGGAARGELWPQVLADVLGVTVRVPAVTESSALGAAIYAGLGAGLHGRLEDALERVVRFDRHFAPQAGAAAAYDELYAGWRRLYARSLDLVEEGLAAPLWRAAGT